MSTLPIDDRRLERKNGSLFGRPALLGNRTSVSYVEDLADIGIDEGITVAYYGASSTFNGKIGKVTIEQKK